MKKLFFLFISILCLASCSPEQSSVNTSDHPHDPWVFRSVLDQQARMITIALDKDVWLSYNTQTGAVYKVWKGLVNFQGAVYDHAHGPQPTSVGDAYMPTTTQSPFQLIKDGDLIESAYHYRGHRFVDGHIELMFALEDLANAKRFDFSELIQIQKADNETKKYLEWTVKTNDFANEYALRRNSKVASVVSVDQFIRPNNFVISDTLSYDFEGREFYELNGYMDLGPKQTEKLMMRILEPTFLDPNLDDGFEEEAGSLPPGAILIAKNDCKTCHNKTKQTVGPAYVSIAKRYEHNEASLQLLSDKIKLGGQGVWGQQAMTAHPEIPQADVESMVNYIFTLADFEGVSSDVKENLITRRAAEVNEEDLIPGALTSIYNISTSATKIPKNLESKKAIMAGIMPNFGNISGSDFIGLDEWFALLANGYLYIEEAGEYDLRIWSDDGSRLSINGETVIDHDGPHGTSMKETRLAFEKGYHPLKLEFYQGAIGKFLSLNYKKAESDTWAVVPPNMIFHNKNDHNIIGDLSLPMSVITKIPGDANPLDAVHPSFTLTQARPNNFKPKVGGMDFLDDGRLLVSTWDPMGGVYILENVSSGDSTQMTAKQIAFGLAEPLGLRVVNGRIFVMQKQEITELIDTNSDDIIDEYRTLCDDWGVTSNFHEFGFGLEEKDGFLYANLATGILPGGAGMLNQHPDRGTTLKINIEDGSYEAIASGLRTPNGVGRGYKDEIFVSDNQGDWLPSSKILHVSEGAWFGSKAVNSEIDLVEKPPVVWLPQDEIGNSPSTPLKIDIGPYAGQMIHGEVTHGGIKRVFVEEVAGAYQGGVFRFIQGMESGINRIVWGPDDALYAGGIGNPGNWQHDGKKWYGLQRLEYNEESTFEMLAVRAKSNGLEIEFTEAMKPGEGQSLDDYHIKQWYYQATANYGGPKIDEQTLDLLSVNISEDRKRVFLELDGMKAGHVIYLRLLGKMISENENSLWSTEAWYTMNNIPEAQEGFKNPSIVETENNRLKQHESEGNWELLFDGSSMEHWKGFNKTEVDSKWSIVDDAIHFNPAAEGQGGDIITKKIYENFELNLEWKIQNCGNSGIFYNVVEGEQYCCPWLTGPEMQVLDNSCHPDSKYRTHRAGDLYDMIETKYVTVNPAGQWNKIRLISDQGQVNFWLNGYKVVSFKMHDDNWLDMIANSKFKDMPDFGLSKQGHIGLQDHGDRVWYRNIKIKEL